MANRQIGIYKITNPSSKVYIGQSWDIVNRFRKYKSVTSIKKQRFLYNSIKKHGIDAHNFEIVYILPTDVEQSTLDNYEIFYITQFREAGYEMMNIKEGGLGGKLPKESIRKMVETRGKWNHSEETKEKIRNSHKGMKHSLETKQKIKDLVRSGNLVLNTETGIFYDNVSLAARVFNINQRTLHNRLVGVSKNKTSLILI